MSIIAVVNGPNLDFLGTREPQIYGADTLAEVELRCLEAAVALGLEVRFFQSNSEGALVEHLHELIGAVDGLVINAAAYTHTSVAIRDAVALLSVPFVEVHISNVHAREPFRHTSYLSDLASGVIVGCGVQGYDFAIERLAALIGPDRT